MASLSGREQWWQELLRSPRRFNLIDSLKTDSQINPIVTDIFERHPDLKEREEEIWLQVGLLEKVNALALSENPPRGSQSRVAEEFGLRRQAVNRMVTLTRKEIELFNRQADEGLEALRNDPEFQEKLRQRREKWRNTVVNP